ncbi:LacI family DNA-binding transcriptional regulator [Geodermatophilus chilensis]|uniref:LacI family DNA-binding transcriptional regulator n=1 Tax=Geodermatophilus chilensis TaxID=2035835 RepID=UPI000C261036|nr:substrate-binding domain-containing protein [Geodermatophilus chilensis]
MDLTHPEGGERVTLRDVAVRAGVHVSTASRVLRRRDRGTESRGRLSDTAERVRRIADELGYRPDPYAASLRTQRTDTFGVLVPALTDLVLATIYDAIEETAKERGYDTFVANTRDDLEEQRRRVDLLLDRRVDGLILGDARLDSTFVDELAARDVPFVLTSRRHGAHPSVTCDDELGGRLAAQHLLALGHRRVAVVAGEPYASTGQDRTRGFLDVCRESGVRVPASRVLHSRFDVAGGRAAAERLLAVRTPPTAVFAVNDFAAIGVMGALRDYGMRVGEDVAVVGYNDVPIARELPVPLSTVRSPLREMGEQAVAALCARLDGQDIGVVRLAPEMIRRASSVPVRRDQG